MTINSITLYANPYDMDAQGFYFHTLEEYTEKSEALRNKYGQEVEEFEIDFIDGDDGELFNACGINQANMGDWFERGLDVLDELEKVELFYRCSDLMESLSDALDNIGDNGYIFQGTGAEYIDDFIESAGLLDSIPEQLRYYFDAEAYGRDAESNGDFSVFEYDAQDYVAAGWC